MRPDEAAQLQALIDAGHTVIRTSNIKTYWDCARKLAFELIDGLESPSGAAAQLGSATHDVLETHFDSGFWTGEGRPGDLARALLTLYDFVPTDERLRVERLFLSPHEDWVYRGTPDLEFQDDDGEWHVVDHKTSGDPLKWGLRASTICKDAQAVSYSWNSMLRTGAQRVHLHWGYVNTRGKPKPYLVENTITREEAFERIETNHQACREIIEITKHDRANDVEPNYNVCGKYGGCPFVDYCNRSTRSLRELIQIRRQKKLELQGEIDVDVSEVTKRLAEKRRKKQAGQAEEPKTTKKTTKKKAPPRNPPAPPNGKAAKAKTNGTRKTNGKATRGTPGEEEAPKEKNWKKWLKNKKQDEETAPEAKSRDIRDRVGRNPKDVIDEYERQQKDEEPEDEDLEDEDLEDEEPEDEDEEPQVNAPEVDTGDDEALTNISKQGLTEDGALDKEALRAAAEEEAARNAGKADALEAHQVMERLAKKPGEEVRLSTKRANESAVYVQKKTLEALAAAGKIEFYIAGQIAHITLPDPRERHADAWLRCLEIAFRHGEAGDEVAGADSLFEEYRKRFG